MHVLVTYSLHQNISKSNILENKAKICYMM